MKRFHQKKSQGRTREKARGQYLLLSREREEVGRRTRQNTPTFSSDRDHLRKTCQAAAAVMKIVSLPLREATRGATSYERQAENCEKINIIIVYFLFREVEKPDLGKRGG